MGENWDSVLFLQEECDMELYSLMKQNQNEHFLKEFDDQQKILLNDPTSIRSLKSESKRGKQPWKPQENYRLQKLHHEMGNKWCSLAQHFDNKGQNDVKNHFFSQLRMALRHLNKIVEKSGRCRMKPIKAGIIYKMISTCDMKFKDNSKVKKELIDLATRIKEGLFSFLDSRQENQQNLAIQIAGMLKNFSLLVCRNSKGKKSKAWKQLQEVQGNYENERENGLNCSISHIFGLQDEFYLREENFIPEDSKTKEEIVEIVQEALKENDSSQIMLEKPEICLLSPFERIKIICEEEQGFPTLFKDEEGYSPIYLWNEEKSLAHDYNRHQRP